MTTGRRWISGAAVIKGAAILAVTLASAALPLGAVPAAYAQSPLTLVPNSVNMFRDTRAPNNIGVGAGDFLQYGAQIQGGSGGASVGAVYPPDGFVDPQGVCTPLAADPNFCGNSVAFNVNRLETPWSLRFLRGEDQVIVSGPDLTVNDGAILNPVPFPSSFTITAGATPVTPTLSWFCPRDSFPMESESPSTTRTTGWPTAHRTSFTAWRCRPRPRAMPSRPFSARGARSASTATTRSVSRSSRPGPT